MTRSTRDILDRLVASLQAREETAAFDGWSSDEVAVYNHAREVFISGGARSVEALLLPERWLQINVTEGASSTFLTGPLRARVAGWLAEGHVRHFFFMRKPPGVRLRFFGLPEAPDAQRAVLGFLEAERLRGAIDGYAAGVYDAETYQFGGVAGLALMHQHATYDSLAVLALLEAEQRGRLSADLSIFSILLLSDLVRKVALDAYEAWDVWENMNLAGRVIDAQLDPEERRELERDADDQREILLAAWEQPEVLLGQMSLEDRRLVEDYFAQNTRWLERYREVVSKGELLYGMRQILPFYVIFHWNRLGFSYEVQCALSFYLRRTFNPKLPAA